MICVRHVLPEEREQLVELALHFTAIEPYNTLLADVPDRAAAIERWLDKVVALVDVDRAVILGAEYEGELVGAIVFALTPHDLTEELYASELAYWVEPKARHTGAGYHLLRLSEEWARTHQVKTLKLSAPIPATFGRALERQGYVALETVYLKVL